MKNKISVSKLGSKGRITIPKRIRVALGLQAGDRVRFVEQEGDIFLKPAKPSLRDFIGSVEPKERPEDFDNVRRETKRRRTDKNDTD